MKKLLTILWIVIIIGIVIISIHTFKPKSDPNEINFEEQGTTKEETVEIPTPIQTVEEPTKQPISVPQDKEIKTYHEYLSQGDNDVTNREIDSAIKDYSTAVNLNPRSTEPLIKLAEAYLLNNEPDKALETFYKARKIDSDSIQIQLGIARSLLAQRNHKGAKSIIWELDSNNYSVKYYTAIILIIAGDNEGAKNLFQEIDTTQTPINNNLKKKAKKLLDAYKTFSFYKEGDPLYLRVLIAKSLTEVGEFNAAIPVLLDIVDKKIDYRDAWIILGYSYLNTEKIQDAIDALKQAKTLDNENPETLFYLGLSYFANNEIDIAIKYLEDADKAGFEPKEVLDLKLGELYIFQGEYQAAAKKYEKILAKNTDYLHIYVRTIWLEIDKLSNPHRALELAQKALKFHPNDPMSYNLVGWALTANGRYSDAKRYLSKALEIKPNFDAANLNLGWLYERQNARTLAKEYYKKAFSLGKENSIAALAAQRYNNLIESEKSKITRTVVSN